MAQFAEMGRRERNRGFFYLFYERFMTVIKSSACRRVKFEMPVRQLSEMLSRYLDIPLANFY